MQQVVDQVAQSEGYAAELIAVTHPAQWGSYKKSLLTGALAAAGLADIILVTEPAAAVASVVVPEAGRERRVVVYDIGGTGFSATLVAGRHSEIEIVGSPQGLDLMGGDDFDQAVFSQVRTSAALTGLDAADREAMTALGRLRQRRPR